MLEWRNTDEPKEDPGARFTRALAALPADLRAVEAKWAKAGSATQTLDALDALIDHATAAREHLVEAIE